MTRSALERLKPRASSSLQLALAGGLWAVVGLLLLLAGARWTLQAAGPARGPLLAALGVAAGVAKSRLVLDRTAGRIAGRIVERGDGRCVGGFLSVRSWLFVALMAGAGRLLRGGIAPMTVVGPLYVAVGTGLLLSSRIAWSRRRALASA